jgi:hypothetical protein
LVDFLRSYWRTLRGPRWATLSGAALTVVPLVLAVIDSGHVWMWLALGLFVLNVVQALGAYLEFRQRATQRRTFNSQVDELFQEGMALVGELSVEIAPDATEIPLVPEGEHIERAADFLGRVREKALSAPSQGNPLQAARGGKSEEGTRLLLDARPGVLACPVDPTANVPAPLPNTDRPGFEYTLNFRRVVR